jgi:hypothetical protein
MLKLMSASANSTALYAFTIPVFIRALENMQQMLMKAERHARQHKIELPVLASARLYPDMFNLLQQVQYLCFIPVDFAKHFSSAPAPRVGYDETTLAELKTSIKQTIAYLRAIKPKQFEMREKTALPLFVDPSTELPAEVYATRLSLPDFFFHAAVAYAILRHNGVPLGKADFLGSLEAAPIKKTKRD